MKMFSGLLLMLGLFNGTQANAATKNEIWDMLQRIDYEIRYYYQEPATLDQVKYHLENAFAALRGGVQNPQACLDYAFEEYRKDGYSNGTAMDKSKIFCQKLQSQRTDLQVIQYMYGWLKTDGYSSASSLEYSLNLGNGVDMVKLDCIKSAYPRYRQDGYSAKTSLEKSKNFCN